MNISECSHPNDKRVICHREGTIVCQECALVLESQWSENSNVFSDWDEKHFEDKKYLTDIVENNFLPKNVIPKVINKCQNNSKKSKLDLAHSLYMTLKEYNIPRSIDEVAYMFEVNESNLWKRGRRLNDISAIKPSNLLSRMNTSSLTDDEKKQIIVKADYFSEFFSISPRTLLAAVWYMVCGNESVKNIAKICSVSPTSIARTVKRLSTHDLG